LNTDLGNAQPKFSIGLNTSVRYKDFDFAISTYGLFGQKAFNATSMVINDMSRFPNQNVLPQVFNDSITSAPTYSSFWIEDASFFRIQSVTLGYTFKFNDIGINKLRLYATAENLLVISKYKGLDPEIDISGLDNPGIDMYNIYPKPRTILFGLSVVF